MSLLLKTVWKLQLVFNVAARLQTSTRQEHVTLVFHWFPLPVCFLVQLKMLVIIFKALNYLGPGYLKNLLPYEPVQTLSQSLH